MVQKLLLGVLVCLAGIAVFCGCGRGGPASSPEDQRSPLASTTGVETTAVPQAEGVPPGSDATQDPGRAVYAANCMRCHGDSALGDGPDAASLSKRPANLQEHVPHHSDKALTAVIRGGRSPMPAFEDLSDQEIENLLHYLRELAEGTEQSGHTH